MNDDESKLSRRDFLGAGTSLLALAAIGCTQPLGAKTMTETRLRPRASLPTTELPWLRLHDHFVATVGANAGQGRPLGSLLVLADATFAPRSRFPIHPHRDMEILSLVVRGELSHHGDQAHGATLKARQAQLISARDGMVHAEGNELDEETHMLQIWFRPETRGGEAAYFLRDVPVMPAGGRHLVAGDEGMPLRTAARVWWIDLVPGRDERLDLAKGNSGYLLAMDAAVALEGGATLAKGDGAELRGGSAAIRAKDGPASALWIELPIG